MNGTLIQAWASHKSVQPKTAPGEPRAPPSCGAWPAGRIGERDWRGQTRSTDTHASITDPDARLARTSNGLASTLAYAGHVLMENRSGLAAQSCLTRATGTAEHEADFILVDRQAPRWQITLGADKGFDVMGIVAALRQRRVKPHIATDRRISKLGVVRRPGIDQRTRRHLGNVASQRERKRIEKVFGWIKAAAGLRQTKHQGRSRVGWCFDLANTAYYVIRVGRLFAT